MTLNSFFLIIRRQIQQKWGRFLLASCGIMIGIWAICLTTSLSLGLSDTIVKAINSQPFARQIQLTKTVDSKTSFTELTSAPVFEIVSPQKVDELKKFNQNIVEINKEGSLSFFIHSEENSSTNCLETSLMRNGDFSSDGEVGMGTQSDVPTSATQTGCINLTTTQNSFINFYENNKSNWYGKLTKPDKNEIVVCFKCGDANLGEKFGVDNPSDLLGKQIKIELQRAPDWFEVGKSVNVVNFESPRTLITESKIIDFKIVGVVDDRGQNIFSGGSNPIYLDQDYYSQAFQLANPELNPKNYAPIQYNVFVDSYQNLNEVIDDLRENKFLVFSLAQTLVNAIQIAFLVILIVLGLFGFVALVASLFGIINVMTISILERKKEIGILKSLGSRDRDIFLLFLFESILLGIFGWLLGVILALGSGQIIKNVFLYIIDNNSTWKDNLKTLNIESFSPSFPIYLLVGTFILAVVFTTISGVFPAIRAARQNPVEVLRSE
jgi:ABC-type antimicrobial peptide transport system permease subunit